LQSKQNLPLIENYLCKIQSLQSELLEKEKINTQLQIEYTKLHEISERDEQILIKKNETIYNLVRENKDMKRAVNYLKREIKELNGVHDNGES
jgi:hypothetical protein